MLVSSCSRLFECIELDGSDNCCCRRYRPSRISSTPGRAHLVLLAGLWSRVALECLSRGITVLDIKTAMRKVLERVVASKAQALTAIAHQMRLYKDGEAIWRDADGAGVYDNVWRRALDLVFLVLQSDTEIITGVSEGENVFRELMYL
ncbi:hypothetical protein cypCar_00018551 [Cyprinus carpio]|nr:hypothetical protein cypCar_00018551 [Cyprinus carpio]